MTTRYKLGIAGGLLAWAAGAALDVISTRQALAVGLVETNPIYGSHASVLELLYVSIIALVVTAALYYLMEKEDKTKYLAWWVPLVMGVASAAPRVWAAVHNWKLIQGVAG